MGRSSSWPLAERSYAAAPARRKQGLPRVAWVLVASAFLCGGLLSAAAFAVGWKHEAQRGSTAQSALVAATARNHRLQTALAAARADAERLALRARRANARSHVLEQRAHAAAGALVASGKTAASVSLGASTTAQELGKLASAVRGLTSYLTTTPASQLDSGYVATQTTYLTKSIARLDATRATLASSLDAYAAAVKKAADRAAGVSP